MVQYVCGQRGMGVIGIKCARLGLPGRHSSAGASSTAAWERIN